MIGPPDTLADPAQMVAWIVPPPALMVAVPPLVKVGQVPITVGRFGGIVPPVP